MTLVLTTNVVGQRRGEPVRLPNRRRRLSTIVARHRPPAGRPFIVSVHRRGDAAEIYQPNDRTVRLRATWSKTLVGPQDVVVITAAPLGKGVLSIGLAIASIALIAIAPYAAPVLAGAALFGAGAGAAAGGLATAIQVGLVVGGVALGYAAQASKASGNKKAAESYSITGGGNVPKPGARKPLLYGRRWSAPPLSQQDFVNIDGDSTVLVKRMTLGLGKFQIHRVRVGDALFWVENAGIQAPFNASTGPLGADIEFLYEEPSTLAPGDIITSPSVGGQELPRPGGNPSRTPWFRLAPQGVSVDSAQMNWTYPAIYRLNSEGKEKGTSAGVVFFGREINPDTGDVIGPEFQLWRSEEPSPAFIRTPLRRVAYFRLPKSGAYEVSAQNAFPEAPASEKQENRVTWDAMYAFEDDTRIRSQTTEIALRMRAGKGLTVTAYSDITVEATRIIPVWTGSAWVEQPTRKAVWAFCDLMRAEYGLDAISGADADKALYYANLLGENDTFDGQLPEVSSFWEAASEILHPLRADPVKVGAIHSFVRDESRAEPRHVITRRQIVRDSGGATFKTKVEGGDVIVEFDRDGDPKRPDEARFSYGTPSRTPKRYRVNGITSGAHAQKHATWLAAVAVFRGAERKVTTEWDGRLVYPGDHVLSDLWFFRGKDAYGVAARAGNVLTLDVTANVPADAWGYGSIRTRAGREWGILRVRGVGPRGLELHPDDVVALQAQTGRLLGDVLASDTQDPTTVVFGELDELQETYVARSAIPSDADHVQIELVKDDARVWQLLDEAVIAPAPVNADSLAEPLVPEIAVLHARCVRIETGIEVVWGVSTTRGARNYEADISYDGGGTREVLSPFGPASSGRAPMRQVEGPATVRARAYGRTGLPGAWKSATFTTIAPVVDGSQTEIINLPPIDYAGLTEGVRGRLDHILEVEAYAQAVAVEAKTDFNAALARAEDVRAYAQGVSAQAQADFQAALGRAEQVQDYAEGVSAQAKVDFIAAVAKADQVQGYAEGVAATAGDALAKAVQSLRNDEANQASIVSEATARLTADEATTRVVAGALARIGASEAAIVDERETRATADGATATRIDGLSATVGLNSAAIVSEASTRADGDRVQAERTTALILQTDGDRAYFLAEQRARIENDALSVTNLTALGVQVGNDRAYFLDEQTARITQDEAFASDLTAVRARLGVNEAAILSEASARSSADSAQATRLDGLTARTAQTESSIVNEQTARATADEAQAILITGLDARVGQNTATITSTSNALAEVNYALTTAVDVLRARSGDIEASIIQERTARTTQIAAEVYVLNALIARVNGDAYGWVLSEQSARADADSAQALRIDGVSAAVGQNTAGLVEERKARADGDSAVTSYVQSLESTVGGNYGAFLTEIQARADADSALSSRIDSFSAQVGDSGAAIVEERRVRAEADSANASRSANLESYVFGDNTPGSLPQTRASILSEAQTRADADSATATRIDGLSARVAGNEASIIEERQVRADADSANTRYIQSIETTVGGNYNLLLTEQTTRATQDQAITGYISYVESVVGSNYGQFIDERTTRVNAESALSQRIESTLAVVGTNYALLTDEITARVNGNNALSQRVSDVQARTDAGTATGRLSFVAQSGPAGVSARIQALVAVQAGGQTRGAGLSIEAMDDGTSRVVVDANAFYITANGQSMPTFSFDGYTLRVPNLQLTAPNVPQGVANTPARFDASNYTLVAGQGAFNNAYDQNMITNIFVDNNSYPTLVSLRGNVQLGPGTQLGPMTLLIDGNPVAPVLFGGNTVGVSTINNQGSQSDFYAFALIFLGAGNHQARFRYSYIGQQTGSSVVITEIHLAASTPRA